MDEQIRILFVDDEKNILRAMERLFLDDNYEVLTAASAGEGLEVLHRLMPVHIVISDYMMPEVNGVKFLEEVCKNWPETVRIVLSGYADTAAVISAINEGQIYKFIPKPWNDDELKVTVSNAVERYRLHKENMLLSEQLREKNEELRTANLNFKRIISGKASDPASKDMAYKYFQSLFDSLPVAIMSVGRDCLISYCNREGERLFSAEAGSIVGKNREKCLPAAINGFIERVFKKEKLSMEHLLIDDIDIKCKGSLIKDIEKKEEVVLVCDRESGNG